MYKWILVLLCVGCGGLGRGSKDLLPVNSGDAPEGSGAENGGDGVAPLVTITAAPAAIRGGTTLSVSFAIVESSTITSVRIDLAADGSTFSPPIALDPSATEATIDVPVVDFSLAVVRVTATDDGNNTASGLHTLAIDSTPPAARDVALAGATPTADALVGVLVADCTDVADVAINDGAFLPCADTHTSLLDADGAHVLDVYLRDAVGNVSAPILVDVTLDTTPPSLTLLSPAAGDRYRASSLETAVWTASDAHLSASSTIALSLDGGATFSPIAADTNSWTTAATSSTTARLRVTVRDDLGHETTATSGTFVIDADTPAVQSLTINGISGFPTPETTADRTAVVAIASTADVTDTVTHYCLKIINNTPPARNAQCWTPVGAPAPILDVDDAPIALGFLPRTVVVYAWVKDAAGNISVNTDTFGADKVQIDYDPGAPPDVVNISATSTDAPCAPFLPADVRVTQGSDVFIKWNASFGANGPAATPISLSYTLDDEVYTPIATVANAQGDCSLAAPANPSCPSGVENSAKTGCYRWVGGAPASTYFKIRVAATNSKDVVTVRSAAPAMNADVINYLAGNADNGIDGNATAAVFINDVKQAGPQYDPASLAISSKGVVYFRDDKRGVLWADPLTGNVTKLLPSANIKAIAIDFQDRLLVWEGTTIRRVGVDAAGWPTTIEDFLTPGVNCENKTNCVMVPLPNGDLWFPTPTTSLQRPNEGFRFRRYVAETGVVEEVTPHGTGYTASATADMADCAIFSPSLTFHPISSAIGNIFAHVFDYQPVSDCSVGYGWVLYAPDGLVLPPLQSPDSLVNVNGGFRNFTGMDGNRYVFAHEWKYGIYKNVHGTSTWTHEVGDGVGPGITCNDGDVATSCRIEPQDVFVDASGTIHWVEHGRVRMKDRDGKVRTIMGQALGFGDDGASLSARSGFISQFRTWRDGGGALHLVFADVPANRLRDATVGGNVTRRAGNGMGGWSDHTQPALSTPLSLDQFASFAVNASDGSIYYGNHYVAGVGYSLSRLDVGAASTWVSTVGGGTTRYFAAGADGLAGNAINFQHYRQSTLGIANGNVFVGFIDHNGNWKDAFVKRYDMANNGTQAHVTGVTGPIGNWCRNGVTPRESCGIQWFYGGQAMQPIRDDVGARWIVADTASPHVGSYFRTLGDAAGSPVRNLFYLSDGFLSFTYRRTMVPGAESATFYYCHTSGRLKRVDLTPLNVTEIPPASPSFTGTELPWPVPSMKCDGSSLQWDETRGSIIFSYEQGGLYGLAEYVNPP